MRNQLGFTLVETLLVLLVVLVIGFGGYYVWGQQQVEDNDEASQVIDSDAVPSDDEATLSEIPDDFVLYQDSDIGFEFIHPEAWGDVEVNRFDMEHDGAQYSIDFSSSEVMGSIATADFEFTGPPMGGGIREIGRPDFGYNVAQYDARNTAFSSDSYLVGASSLCEYAGVINLRLYIGELDDFSLMQFTYPHQVPEGFDCRQDAGEDDQLLTFFDDSLISDFQAMGAYSEQ